MIVVQHTLAMDIELFFRVIIACLLGCIIGYERERHKKNISAGIRTYGAIALGACAYTVIGLYLSDSDPARIPAQVVTGIGFLGGGLIFRQGEAVTGLTTAATLWATAAVGLSIGVGMYLTGCLVALLILTLLYLPRMKWWKNISTKMDRMKD